MDRSTDNSNTDADRKLVEQARREQDEAKAAEIAEYQASEREVLKDVDPHWPTYNRVMALAAECREWKDAVRHRDIGDVVAFKHAPHELMQLAELVVLDDRSVAADILKKTGGAMSDKQAKLVALILAKRATLNGMTGERPVGPDTVDRQENVSRENEHISLPINRGLKQRVTVQMIASKKVGKPYLAKLAGNFRDREFAKGTKFTNSTKRFALEGLQCGDVIEFRGYNWSGGEGSYEGGTEYALVGNGAVYIISRSAAREAANGADMIMIDEATPVIRLSPDAPVPAELKPYQNRDFSAWLTNDRGEPLSFSSSSNDSDLASEDDV